MLLRNVFVLAFVALLSSACAQITASNQLTRYQLDLNPITGTATQDDIVRQYGAPKEKRKVGALEVWTYHFSYGHRGATVISPYVPYDQYGFAWGRNYGVARGATQSREEYDLLTLRFRGDGVLDSWRVYVQR